MTSKPFGWEYRVKDPKDPKGPKPRMVKKGQVSTEIQKQRSVTKLQHKNSKLSDRKSRVMVQNLKDARSLSPHRDAKTTLKRIKYVK